MTDEEIDELVERMLAEQTVEMDNEVNEPAGPPLTIADIADATERLAQWQTPATFNHDSMSLCRRCQSEDYFNRPQLKFLQDAFVLAKFAKLMQAQEVRLAARESQWPDGLIKFAGATHDVEIVSTHGGRLLGKEYR